MPLRHATSAVFTRSEGENARNMRAQYRRTEHGGECNKSNLFLCFFTIYGMISVIYMNLISLNNQIKILFNHIKHYLAAKQYTLFVNNPLFSRKMNQSFQCVQKV